MKTKYKILKFIRKAKDQYNAIDPKHPGMTLAICKPLGKRMKKHFLFKSGLYGLWRHRACKPDWMYAPQAYAHAQGTFLRKGVTCGNCKRTKAFKKLKEKKT